MSEEIIPTDTKLKAPEANEIIKAAIEHNNGGFFEYKVVSVSDLTDGSANASKIEEVLNLYGEMGWMFKEAIVNEIGHTFTSNDDFGVPSTTQEQTMLVFERWRRY